MSNFLFNLNITQPKESPPQTCENGCPTNLYPKMKYPNPDLLYSTYQTYQQSATPTYLQNNIAALCNTEPTTNPPYYGPANIFIGMEGEKNTNSSSTTIYYQLDCNGIQRSAELPDLMNDLATSGYPIFAIFTCNAHMQITSSSTDIATRPQQTAFLSSWLLNIPLYIYNNQNITQPYNAATAIEIFTNPLFRGKNIFIIWEHNNTQGLTNQLVQCNEYINIIPQTPAQQDTAVANLVGDPTGINTLFNTDTQQWWETNTIVPLNNRYEGQTYPGLTKGYNGIIDESTGQGQIGYIEGLVGGQCAYSYQIPYASYSHLLPYYNENCYNIIYWLYQNSTDGLKMTAFTENIETCFQNCELVVGALEYATCLTGNPNWTNSYTNEANCQPPPPPPYPSYTEYYSPPDPPFVPPTPQDL